MTGLPGGLGRLRVRDGQVHLEVLDDAGHHLATALPVTHAEVHALHHLHALHTGSTAPALERRPQVELLSAAVAVAGGRVRALVVDAGPPVSFALALQLHGTDREVPLDLVDAAGLIFARQIPLEVRAPAPDWDREIGELLGS